MKIDLTGIKKNVEKIGEIDNGIADSINKILVQATEGFEAGRLTAGDLRDITIRFQGTIKSEIALRSIYARNVVISLVREVFQAVLTVVGGSLTL